MNNQQEKKKKIELGNCVEQRKISGCCVLIGLIMVLIIIFGLLSSSENSNNSTLSGNDQAIIKDRIVNEIAPIYCQNHKSFRLEKVDSLTQAGFPMFDGINGYDSEDCRTVINKLYDIDNNENHLMKVANKIIFMGMDYRLLIFSWGAPNDMNSTTTAWFNSTQWVYGNPIYNAQYVYTDNGKVTSWQDF